MADIEAQLSTGLAGLDRLLKGLMPGDNVVWHVDSMEDFVPFAEPYCRHALASGRRLIYFRFAGHRPLAGADSGAEVHQVHPEAGFEQFIAEIHQVIKDTGRGGHYLFDSLSQLAVDWYSDQMLGNFFMLTCPYLYDMGTIAYFPLLRNYHSFYATGPIAETTQVLLDVLRHKGTLYLHPVKVQQRYSTTMYMLHAWQGDDFAPVMQSTAISEILRAVPWQGLEAASNRLDVWDRTFLEAEEALAAVRRGEAPPERTEEYFQRLLRMAVSRHERMLGLARKYLTLSDVLDIGRRMVGTGLIGGKSVGMLLARAILEQSDRRWADVFEPHDSFFIGSDVFYTFLVSNGIWWVRQQQRNPATFLEGAETARQRILVGAFPGHIERQFGDMLDYFGQSPIIVRSSSLLEDNFGNAFAGKYESIFCVNQGPRHKRMEDFLSAVRTIYASTMSEKALTYRAQRGMLDRDEQMALLVQRVSGAVYDGLFYPQVAGVGLSFNPYVWNKDIDPTTGVVRLVFGLGTRAVERHDDDYTRVVALNAPEKRPEADLGGARQYTQRKDKLLTQTPLVGDMRDLLRTLQSAYDYPVDVEFTANFLGQGQYKINLLQCRPFQCKGGAVVPQAPEQIPREDLLLDARGAVIGQSREARIDRLIYVMPSAYGRLPLSDRYEVARLIGRITHVQEARPPQTVMLLGPGRWGTTMPSLGVPIRFSDISRISMLCEIVAMHEGLVPDVSLGTHVFSEMVEMDILYLALFPSRQDNFLNAGFFDSARNRLAELLPDAARWADAVRVIDAADLGDGAVVKLNANTLEQRVVCYLERPAG
ncbi:MAG: hypothetical protein AMJ81_13770 [Phycisphaerae bacterium SM23_33]|nr:MAG: hypothetical protein AMJ81_13770 [Phycisphaerae bacterium SM23_33]